MRTLMAMLLALLLTSTSHCEDDVTRRWRTEAPEAWLALEQFLSEVSGKSRLTEHVKPPNVVEAYYRFLRNGEWIIIDRTDKKQVQGMPDVFRNNVFGMNSHYSFRLGRKAADGPFVLSDVRDSGPLQGQTYTNFLSHCLPHLSTLEGRLLSTIVTHPKFLLKQVRAVRRADADVVLLQFAFPHPSNRSLDIVDAQLYLDPAKYWCVVEGKYEFTNSRNHQEFTFGEPIEGRPMLKSFVNKLHGSGSETAEWDVSTIRYTELRKEKLPEYRFSVTEFGLPEINTAIARPRRWYLWFIAAGVAAGMALLFRKWAVSRSASARG